MKQIQQAFCTVDANLPLARVHILDYYCARSTALHFIHSGNACIARQTWRCFSAW
jgi:hypothetical protein